MANLQTCQPNRWLLSFSPSGTRPTRKLTAPSCAPCFTLINRTCDAVNHVRVAAVAVVVDVVLDGGAGVELVDHALHGLFAEQLGVLLAVVEGDAVLQHPVVVVDEAAAAEGFRLSISR